jgi:hypothetical protein
MIDFAVNDHDLDYERAAAEALVRRIRTALPDAKLIAPLFLTVGNPAVNDPTNTTETQKQSWIAICDHYGIPYADFAAEVARAVNAAEHPLSYYLSDVVHPTTAGHAVAASLLQAQMPALFAGPQWSGALPARLYDNGDYENEPIIRNGIDHDGVTGTGWETVDTTAIQSSTAGDTITWTGTFQAVLRDMRIGAGSGIVETQVDGGAWTEVNLASDASNYRTHWVGTRGPHTMVMRVKSGLVKIRRFLAI